MSGPPILLARKGSLSPYLWQEELVALPLTSDCGTYLLVKVSADLWTPLVPSHKPHPNSPYPFSHSHLTWKIFLLLLLLDFLEDSLGSLVKSFFPLRRWSGCFDFFICSWSTIKGSVKLLVSLWTVSMISNLILVLKELQFKIG